MSSNINDCFDNTVIDKLYRNVYEIMHPTISKRNVSNYKIILNEDLAPVRVFYPEKGFVLKKIMIYVHGSSSITECNFKYAEVCKMIASRTGRLVIAVDYQERFYLDMQKEVNAVVNFLIRELTSNGILLDDISLMGDDVGANILMGINCEKEVKRLYLYPLLTGAYFTDDELLKDSDFDLLVLHNIRDYFKKCLRYKKDYKNSLVFPSLDKNYKLVNSLLMVGKADPIEEEVVTFYQEHEHEDSELAVIDFIGHGFLNSADFEANEEVFRTILDFLDKEEA